MANNIQAGVGVKISANAVGFAQVVNSAANSLKVLEQRARFVNNLLAGFGVGFGAYMIASAVTDVISKLANFEAEMSKVKAVTQATDEEFKSLRDSALQMAEAYGVSSKGVAELQTQYARLGFSTTEILQSSKVAIQLSRATGEDLAKSAQIAGSTLRSFNLDASQMGRVGNVMAEAFNKSALGLDDFGEAIKYVAPVAANANVTLEQTSALLSVLADSGIKGSQAGTSLRKILTDLGVNAGPMLTQKLREMAEAGLSQADAFDEVGRTAYTSLLVIVKNIEKAEAYTKSLENTKNALDEVATVVKDNLLGDWEKFNSALDITIQKGEGVIPVLRTLLGILKGGVLAAGGSAPVTTGDNWFLNALGIYPEDLKKDAKELSDALATIKFGFDEVISPYISPLIVEFGKSLTVVTKDIQNKLPLLESEAYLKGKLQDLQDKALGQVGFVRAATNVEIKAIQAKIKALQDLGALYDGASKSPFQGIPERFKGMGSVTKPELESSGVNEIQNLKNRTSATYELSQETKDLANSHIDAAAAMAKMNAASVVVIGRAANHFLDLSNEIDSIKDKYAEMAEVSGYTTEIMAAQSKDIAAANARMAQSIIKDMYGVAMAYIAAGAAKQSIKNPIAAALALTAGYILISKFFSKIGAKGGGYSGGSGSGITSGSSYQPIYITVDVMARGSELISTTSEQNRLRGRSRG